jgi:hypothetical protein
MRNPATMNQILALDFRQAVDAAPNEEAETEE